MAPVSISECSSSSSSSGKSSLVWPQAVLESIKSLEEDLENEVLTKKGFWSKKYSVVEEYLLDEQKQKVLEFRVQHKEGKISDQDLYDKMRDIIVPRQEYVDDGAVCEEKPNLFNDEDKENVSNGQNTETNISKSSEVKEEVDAGSSSSSSASAPKSPRSKRTRPSNQQSIQDMFRKAPKRKCTEEAGAIVKKPKECKLERCKICRQNLESADLKHYGEHPNGAKEEFEVMFDERVMLVSDGAMEQDTLPQYKITGFTVYCMENHVCRFDTNLIDTGKEIYFSGYVKPVWSEDPSIADGVPAKNIGPIMSWWNAGYDGGDKPMTGFSTIAAEYILMEPSELYKPIMTTVDEKVFITKHTIEFLDKCVRPESGVGQEFEDLTNYLALVVPKEGMGELNDEMLIKHADFVVHQVYSYEDAGEEDDMKLVNLPAMKNLIRLAGIKLAGRKRELKVKTSNKIMPKHTDATVTPAVRQVFDLIFGDQMRKEADKENKPNSKARSTRCGKCDDCMKKDCGQCRHCKDMTKFGGSGRSKQACMERKCTNKAVKGEDAEISEDEELEQEAEVSPTKKINQMFVKSVTKSKDKHKEIEWEGKGVKIGRKTYYKSAILDGEFTVAPGDTVLIQPDDPSIPLYVATIGYIYDGPDGAKAHVQWFGRGVDTVLGEAADPTELFLLTDCEDQPLLSIWKKCNVTQIKQNDQSEWRKEGGKDPVEIMKDDGVNFWYRFHYTPIVARFEYPESWPTYQGSDEDEKMKFCGVCCQRKIEEDRFSPKVHEKTESLDIVSVMWDKAPLKLGDCVYVQPGSIRMAIKKVRDEKLTEIREDVDEDLYPEYYRKGKYVKGNNNETPDPFHICIIKRIFKDCDTVKIRVQVFYRPEDTHKGMKASKSAYYNELFWTEEESTVSFDDVMGRCYVKYYDSNADNKLIEVWAEEGPDRWFFREMYNPHDKMNDEPPLSAQRIGQKGKGGKAKGKGKSSAPKTDENEAETKDADLHFPKYPFVGERLNCLDIFSGCGGLSQGLHESGVADSKWAIEIFEPAAKAYKLNNPDCTVFGDDCNLLLARAIEGIQNNDRGQKIPVQGEVDLLCGGPPCQGFSGMNRFNHREYSQFKNSLVSTYLSYCDYYRPRYFILENVRNFASFKKSMVLKLCLQTLIKLGYQCTFTVLQAGQFGVAQTRRRAIILAAAPGEKLPLFPEPLHVFSPKACSLSVQIDDIRYESNARWTGSAPYRTCTVRDTMSDLPKIKNGADKLEISYGGEAVSHFQKKIRKGSEVLRDHVTKNMAPLIEARFELIPTAPGSDWRDLPNKVMTLKDGSTVKKLQYLYDDVKHGRSSTGAKRGVCSCADGKSKCEPSDKQDRTLIPWCLPHTSARHNNWAGLYGRVEWDGFFSTTVTNPEPMGKQGRVLHPDQNRLVSVRECARSQGFPDTYKFYGTPLEKHRQIGNAVPPPMGKALGIQIRDAMAKSVKN